MFTTREKKQVRKKGEKGWKEGWMKLCVHETRIETGFVSFSFPKFTNRVFPESSSIKL